MTTLNNDELRAGLIDIVGQHLAKWRGTTPLEDYANVDDVYRTLTPELEEYVTQLIATHDQQLLEAILEGIVDADDTRGDTQNGNNPKYWTRRTKVINERNEEIRQHIKSVFRMSKTAKQLDKLLQEKYFFKFLWAMYDELREYDGEHSGTVISRYASHLEQATKDVKLAHKPQRGEK